MRGIWIDAGSNPNTTLLHAHGIRRAYFPAFIKDPETNVWVQNPNLTSRFLYGEDGHGGWRAAVGSVGIYFGTSWPMPGGAVGLAHALSEVLDDAGATNRQCAVHVNVEAKDFDLVTFMVAWRAVRPHREIAWVIEGMQGGRLTAAQVRCINSDTNLIVLAEAFYDAEGQSMLPFDRDRVRCDLIDYGIERARASVMYDAARLNDRWDGCAFTQGRLN